MVLIRSKFELTSLETMVFSIINSRKAGVNTEVIYVFVLRYSEEFIMPEQVETALENLIKLNLVEKI